MSKTDFKNEVRLGLENLNKVYASINYISESSAERLLKVPALTNVLLESHIYGIVLV